MKIIAAPLLIACLLNESHAGILGAPSVSVGLSNTADGKMGGLEPVVSWRTSTATGGYDLESGLDVPVDDLSSLKYSVWGTVKRNVKGWNISTRAEVQSSNLHDVDLDARIEGETSSLRVTGKAEGSNVSVSKVNVKKSLGGLTVNPRVTLGDKTDVSVAYDWENTSVKVDAVRDAQKLTIAQKIGENNLIRPSITTGGDFSVDYERTLDTGTTLTTTLSPNDSVNVKLEDGPWMCNINAPVDGLSFDGITIAIKRNVEIM